MLFLSPFSSNPAAICPQAQSWIFNEKYILATDVVIVLMEFLRIIPRKHRLEIAISKANTLDLFFVELSRAPGNREPSFGAAWISWRLDSLEIGRHRLAAGTLKAVPSRVQVSAACPAAEAMTGEIRKLRWQELLD
jgi:hypothetical protein